MGKALLTQLGALILAMGCLHAMASETTVGGSARVRTEFRDNADFDHVRGDSLSSTHTRIRLDYGFKPNDMVQVFVQPQYTKVWGEPKYVPSGAAANTSTGTSGSTYDSELSVHQAFVSYVPVENLTFTVGRKELNYGDQLLVGGVGWNPVGRAFDLALANYKLSFGSVDLFSSKVKDMNVSSSGPGDKDLAGLYVSSRLGDAFQNVDAYSFCSKDSTGTIQTRTAAYGVRLKSPVGPFDYRVEYTFESVKGTLRTSDENQLDAELGYLILEGQKLRLSAEYFAASDDFDQLYPTGHKWLGYADLFSRRNISGYRVGVSAAPMEKLTLALDYHQFSRTDTNAPAYNLGGVGYGTAGDAKSIGQEWDLVAGYKLPGDVQLEAGAARVEPGTYIKDNRNADLVSFYYVQGSVGF